MTEIWKDVVGYEGLYIISNKANIISLQRIIKNKKGFLINKKQYTMKPRVKPDGYWTVAFIKNGTYKHLKVHRLVALAFIPNPENKRTVNHINCIKADNSVENLEWNTHGENLKHAYRN